MIHDFIQTTVKRKAAKSQERVAWVLMDRVNQPEDIELEEELQDLDIEKASDEEDRTTSSSIFCGSVQGLVKSFVQGLVKSLLTSLPSI